MGAGSAGSEILSKLLLAMASNLLLYSDVLEPNSDGLQPSSDGLQQPSFQTPASDKADFQPGQLDDELGKQAKRSSTSQVQSCWT